MTTANARLPADVKKDLDALREQVQTVHTYWKLLQDLFGSGEEQLRLLTESAGNFFLWVQRSFVDSLILGLSRLTDEPGSGDKENLVLQRLATAIGKAGDRELARRLRVPMKRIRSAVTDLREYRDKVLAHSDRKTARGDQHTEPIPVQSVEDALSAMRDLMNEVDGKYRGVTRWYDEIVIVGGADAIVTWLEDAQAFRQPKYQEEYQKEMIERMKRQAPKEPL